MRKKEPPGAWCAGRPVVRSAKPDQGLVVTRVKVPLPLYEYTRQR